MWSYHTQNVIRKVNQNFYFYLFFPKVFFDRNNYIHVNEFLSEFELSLDSNRTDNLNKFIEKDYFTLEELKDRATPWCIFEMYPNEFEEIQTPCKEFEEKCFAALQQAIRSIDLKKLYAEEDEVR